MMKDPKLQLLELVSYTDNFTAVWKHHSSGDPFRRDNISLLGLVVEATTEMGFKLTTLQL